jgi:hypothetical protein
MSSELITLEQAKPETGIASVGFTNEASFSLAERAARLLSSSTLVPPMYQGEANLGNCVIALHMAARMKADPLMIMQNLFPIQGRPVWSAPFVIAMLNNCGQFSKLKYKLTGTRGEDSFGCIASAVELSSGELLEGTEVTVAMAKAEGWWHKKGSKWPTMTEQMLKYRAATFFARTTVPELLVGLHTSDEVEDFTSLDVSAPAPRATEPPKPQINPMDFLKAQAAQPTVAVVSQESNVAVQPAAVQLPPTTVITAEPGYCTPSQKQSIETLFAQLGISTDDQRGILERRGVGAIRSLTEQQATELIAILQSKLAPPEPEPQLAATPEPEQPGKDAFAGGTTHAGVTSARLDGPCTPEQIKAVEAAVLELEQMVPGSAEAFLVNLADREMMVADLTLVQCDQLLAAIQNKEAQAFFDRVLGLQPS